MSKFHHVALVSMTVLSLAACSSAPVKEAPKAIAKVAECVFPGTSEAAPGWICDEPVDGVEVSAVGVAEATQAGEAFQKQMAATAARVQLAQNVKVQVANMIKQYAETTGAGKDETVDRVNTAVTKQITDQSLVGSKVYRSRVSSTGKMYVLVGIDSANAQKITEAAVKTSMNNDKALWQKFQAGKAQDELAAEIAKQKVDINAEQAAAASQKK